MTLVRDLAGGLVLTTAFAVLLATCGLLAGRSIDALVLPLAIASAGIAVAWLDAIPGQRLSVARAARVSGLVLLVLVASAWFASQFYDVAFDGQTYHQEAVIQLARGWNPFRDGPISVRELWPVDSYPKAVWIAGASLYSVTGGIETAKAWHLVLIAGAAATAWMACVQVSSGRPWAAAGASSVAALNPVATAQWATFCVDGPLASLLLIACASGYRSARYGDRLAFALLCASTVLAVNTKFTGLVYIALLVPVYVGLLWHWQGWRPLRGHAVGLSMALCIAVLVVGANPYVTNTVRHGHPLHPLAGAQTIDIMAMQHPAGLIAGDRLGNLLRATWARSENVIAPQPYRPKWPHQVDWQEFVSFADAEVRVAGFGPLFAAGLVMAAAAWLLLLWRDRRAAGWALVVIVPIVASVFVNPEAWWARFVPQFWLVPVAVGFVASVARYPLAAMTGRVLLVLLAVNAALIALTSTRANLGRTAAVRAQLGRLAAMPQPIPVRFGQFYSNRVRLREAGILYVDMARLPCNRPEALPYSQALFCATDR